MSARVILGDALEVLRGLDAASADALVTDPPSGTSFMGKAWDSDKGGRDQWVAWLAEVMREALRVLKPGSYGLVWALPRTSHWTATALDDAGFEVRDVLVHLFGQGWPKSKACLKPGAEHWILVRAPGPKVRPLQIDACRIGYRYDSDEAVWRESVTHGAKRGVTFSNQRQSDAPFRFATEGRWPANALLSHADECVDDCAPDCPVAHLDAQAGERKSGAKKAGVPRAGNVNAYGASSGVGTKTPIVASTGGASRFFYVGKARAGERGIGGVDNDHPTVKGIELMRWLCRLIAPPGGLVLDCFAGSGTTGIACAREGLSFLGIELNPEYAQLARDRIVGDAPLFGGAS